MSTLVGPLKITGPMGALSFYTTKGGKTIVRQKGGPSREKVLTHPNFIRSRENFADFGSVSKLAANIRRALGPHATHHSEGSYFNRLVGLVKMIANTDPYNVPGTVNPLEGNVYLLEDFQWNAKLSFGDALQTEYASYMDVSTGKLRLEFESFVPVAAVKAPTRATHFQIILKGAVIHDGKDSPAYDPDASPVFALDSTDTGPISLSLDLNTKDGALAMMGAGILFYEEVMGIPMTLRGGAFQITGVERIPSREAEAAVDTETGEVLDNTTSKTEQDNTPENKKKTRAEAMEVMLSSMYSTGFGIKGIHAPIILDRQACIDMEAKLLRVKRQLWLKKLEKYRKG